MPKLRSMQATRCNWVLARALPDSRPQCERYMIRRFMVMIALAVALFPICGDGEDA
jgi:hypothetical protein